MSWQHCKLRILIFSAEQLKKSPVGYLNGDIFSIPKIRGCCLMRGPALPILLSLLC